jgi:phosphopantetheinyl transferase (holo-ACP synthase)
MLVVQDALMHLTRQSLERDHFVQRILQEMEHELISESSKKNIHDVAAPTVFLSKENEGKAVSEKDQGNCIFVQQIRATCGFP